MTLITRKSVLRREADPRLEMLRLRTYYDAFHDRIKELVSRYEMEDQDDIWLCTQMLKRIGVDIEAWHKESDHGT